MNYYQVFLKDKTPKRIILTSKINKSQASKILSIKEEDILLFERIDEKNIEKVPYIKDNKIQYKTRRSKK